MIDFARRIWEGDCLSSTGSFFARTAQLYRPRIAFIEDNTDNFAVSGVLERIQQMQTSLNGPQLPPLQGGQLIPQGLLNGPNLPAYVDIQPVEVYPYIEYIKYLLAGSVSISIFVVAMIGGGIALSMTRRADFTRDIWQRRWRNQI